MPWSFRSSASGVPASRAGVVMPAPSSARRAGALNPAMNAAAGLRAASHREQVGQSLLLK
jgi:hypothetical protein